MSFTSSLDWNQRALDRAQSSQSQADPEARRAAWAAALYYWDQGLSDCPSSLPCQLNRIHALRVLGNSFSVMDEANDLLVRLKTQPELWKSNFSEEQKVYDFYGLLAWELPKLLFEKKARKRSGGGFSLDRYVHYLARWIAHHSGPPYRPEAFPLWRLAYTIDPEDNKARIAIGFYLVKQGQLEGLHLLSQRIKPQSKLTSQWLNVCKRIIKKKLDDKSNDKGSNFEKEVFFPYEGFDLALEADLSCVVTHTLLVDGRWLDPEIDFCRQYLKPGMSVLDVGANIGLYTLLAARYVGKSGRVFAFEPASSAFRCLEKTIQKNSLTKNVSLLKLAVSDRSGKAYLSVGEDSAFSKIVERLTGIVNPIEHVDTISLDEWWSSTNKSRLDLVKIDTASNSLPILRGARKLLESEKPVIILEREGDSLIQEEAKEILKSLGYRLYSYNSYLNELTQAGKSVASMQSINLVAVPRERVNSLVDQGLLSRKSPQK